MLFIFLHIVPEHWHRPSKRGKNILLYVRKPVDGFISEVLITIGENALPVHWRF